MLNNVRTLWAETVAALKKSERHYALDDTHALHVELMPTHLDPDRLRAHVAIYERIEERRGESVEVDWDQIDMDGLPARLLMRVVEIKTLVERWNSTELDELPPSTMPDFLEAQNSRRLARRRRRYS